MSIRRLLVFFLFCALAIPIGRGVARPSPIGAAAKINAAGLTAAPNRPIQVVIQPADDAQIAQLATRLQSGVAAVQTQLNLHGLTSAACDPAAQDAVVQAISAPTPGVEPAIHLAAVKRASLALSQVGPQDPCTRAAFAQAIQLESDSLAAPVIVHHRELVQSLSAAVPALSSAPPLSAAPSAGPIDNPANVAAQGGAPTATAGAACKAGDGLPGLPACYNAPPAIPLYTETKFTLIIASNHLPSDADFQGNPGPVDERNVPLAVGSIVKAELTGPADQVTIDSSRTYICQTVTAGDNSRWDWYVSPKTRAPIQLQVTLWEVKSCDSDDYTSHYIDSFTIPVTASFTSLVKYYASPLNTTLLAILALITAFGGAFGAWKWLSPHKGGSKDA